MPESTPWEIPSLDPNFETAFERSKRVKREKQVLEITYPKQEVLPIIQKANQEVRKIFVKIDERPAKTQKYVMEKVLHALEYPLEMHKIKAAITTHPYAFNFDKEFLLIELKKKLANQEYDQKTLSAAIWEVEESDWKDLESLEELQRKFTSMI